MPNTKDLRLNEQEIGILTLALQEFWLSNTQKLQKPESLGTIEEKLIRQFEADSKKLITKLEEHE